MLISCKILCGNGKLSDLGLEGEDVWIDGAIDLLNVVAIKQTDENFEHETTMYMTSGDRFVTDLNYYYALHLFEFTRKDNKIWLERANEEWKKKLKK